MKTDTAVQYAGIAHAVCGVVILGPMKKGRGMPGLLAQTSKGLLAGSRCSSFGLGGSLGLVVLDLVVLGSRSRSSSRGAGSGSRCLSERSGSEQTQCGGDDQRLFHDEPFSTGNSLLALTWLMSSAMAH